MNKNIAETFQKEVLYTLILALLLRIIWVVCIPVIPVSDSVMYHEFALSITQGIGYAYPDGTLTAYWPVGTSAIYAFLYSLLGEHYQVIAIFNILISLLMTYLIIAIGQHWFGKRVGILAGLIYAVWPSQIQFTTILASELLFNFFMLVGIYVWLKQDKKKFLFLIISAVFFTAAAYVRPIALLVPFIMICIEFMNSLNLKRSLLNSIVTGLVMILLISPWAYRNYLIFGEPVLISTNGGPVLWMGNNPLSTGEYMPLPNLHFESEVERAKYYKSEALEHIQEEPLLFIKRMGKRLVDYYRSENIGILWNQKGIAEVDIQRYTLHLKLLSSGFWMAVLLSAFYGLFLLLKQGGWKMVVSTPIPALISYYTILHMIIASGDRYHFPIIPFLAILAAFSIHSLTTKKEFIP